jgi:multiple sugar transport system substrate-binding protein
MSDAPTLRGITWNHTRGYVPLVATAQRFEDLIGGVEIVWQKRSLKDFGDAPLDKMTQDFDLIVIDHPYAGHAAARRILEPLENHLPAAFLSELAAASVGRSYESYWFDGHLWALPIDAAAPVSSWRPDLIERHGVTLPRTFEEVIALARRGLVAVPATPVDSLMHFFMICCALGEEPLTCADSVVSGETGVAALRHLRTLLDCCASECLDRNPIQTYREMATGDRILYCPFAYGYSNYARPGFAPRVLRFGDLVTLSGSQALRSTLGGAGLAISRRCADLALASAYLEFVSSAACQRGLYFDSGGQPGHRSAWKDVRVNSAADGFFESTLPTLDNTYLRPRCDGYVEFQNKASALVHTHLRRGGNFTDVIAGMDQLWRGVMR